MSILTGSATELRMKRSFFLSVCLHKMSFYVQIIVLILSVAASASAILSSTTNRTELLVTTAFWNIHSKKGDPATSLKHYSSRLQLFLNLSIHYVFYGDSSIISSVKIDNNPNSHLVLAVEKNYHEFGPCKSHWTEFEINPGNYVHSEHVPSIDLGCIWLAKLELLHQSSIQQPEYEWLLWLDFGLHTTVAIDPSRFPNLSKLTSLPTDKLIVSYSHVKCLTDHQKQQRFEYDHCIAGTSFLVHRSFIDTVNSAFYDTFEECLQVHKAMNSKQIFPCLHDQVILSHLNSSLLFFYDPVFHDAKYGAVAYDLLS